MTVQLTPGPVDGPIPCLIATRTRYRVRFLLSDGRLVDVITDRDDSDLRFALLMWAGEKTAKIEGSAVLTEPVPASPSLPSLFDELET